MPSNLPRTPKSREPNTIVLHHGERTFSLPLTTQDPTAWIPFLFYLLEHPALVLSPIEITANMLSQLALQKTHLDTSSRPPTIPEK